MSISVLMRESINPALEILGAKFQAQSAQVQLCATAIQESRIETRRQNKGPAVSFYQFEKIGIQDVLERATSSMLAINACGIFDVKPDVNSVYEIFKVPEGDILAGVFARLNYWNNTKPLPSLISPARETLAWDYYIKTWKPGRPHLHTWPMAYWRAFGALVG